MSNNNNNHNHRTPITPFNAKDIMHKMGFEINKKGFQVPIHYKFHIDYTPDLIDNINKMLNLEEVTKATTPPLFTIKTHENDPNPKLEKNMMLTKIVIKCRDCDFNIRISKQHILKHFRMHRRLKTHEAKEHVLRYGHKLEVNQTFEKYLGKV